MGFARKLASPKNKTREKAISLLVLWLTSQKQIEEDELKKIWKGLFYCVWHSDKAAVQADLIERLASIFEKLDSALSLQFFKVFLMTMRREWAGIDRLRLDKFYLLLRKCLVHMLVALERSAWDADLMTDFMDILVENAFLAKDQYAALGINLHYADIYLQELKSFLPLRADTFKLFLEPFLVVCASASDKCLLQRIKANIFDYLFNIGRVVIVAKQEGNSLDPSIESLGSLLFNVPVGSEAFKLASMPSTSQANRKLLYELHTEWETLEKLLNTSSVTHSLAGSSEKKKKRNPKNRKIHQEKVIKASGKKAMGVPSGDMVGTIVLDKGKDKRKSSEVFKEGTLSAESMAGEGKSKRKVSEYEKDIGSESKEEESLGSKRKKMKQKSAGKLKKVASVVGVAKKSCDLAEDFRLEQQAISDGLGMNDTVVSNLERQFDLLADESLIESDTFLSPSMLTSEASSPLNTQSKKRKRRTTSTPLGNGALVFISENSNDGTPLIGRMHGHSPGKVKRVRFALKKNLVWTPSTPLPAESVRVPPSATPRGSALKKGVPPGPIISTTANALRQRKGTPLRPLTYSKTSKNRKSVLKRVKLLAKQHRSV